MEEKCVWREAGGGLLWWLMKGWTTVWLVGGLINMLKTLWVWKKLTFS